MSKSNKQLAPINGYLTYEPGVTERKVTVHTIDDNDPEDDVSYTVLLYSPKGGARLDSAESQMKLKGKFVISHQKYQLSGNPACVVTFN